MTTTIHSNGSKWLGQEPDSIETLLEVLKTETLDPCFEQYGNFYSASEPDGTARFFGNFLTVSHVFNLDTDDLSTIKTLVAAIEHNKSEEAYLKARGGRP